MILYLIINKLVYIIWENTAFKINTLFALIIGWLMFQKQRSKMRGIGILFIRKYAYMGIYIGFYPMPSLPFITTQYI